MPIDTSKYLPSGSSSSGINTSKYLGDNSSSKVDTSKYLQSANQHADEVQLSDQAQMDEASRVAHERTVADQANFIKSGANLDVSKSPVMQQIKQTPHEPTLAEQRSQEPSRQLPIIGPILHGLDMVAQNPITEKVAEIGREFYTPGASLENIAGLTGAAENAVSRLAPGLGKSLAGRAAQKAATEAITGAPLAAGQSLTQTGDLQESAKQGAYGAAIGGGLGAAAPVVGAGLSKIAERYSGTTIGDALGRFFSKPVSEPSSVEPLLGLPRPGETAGSRPLTLREGTAPSGDVIHATGDVNKPPVLALPEGKYTPPTRLKVADNNQTLDYVIRQIKPEVEQTIQAPTRRDLLVNYLTHHLEVPLQEIHNMPIKDLQELGQLTEHGLRQRVPEIAFQAAQKRGYDLPSLLDGKAPTVAERGAQFAQQRAYGVYPESLPNVKPPQFNKQVVSEAFPPLQKGFRRVESTMPKAEARYIPSEPITRASTRTETPVQPRSPVTDAQITEPGGTFVRGNYKNQLDNGNFSGDLQQGIRNTDQTYDRISNAESVAKANENVKNLSKAESDFLLNQSGGADHIATGYRLMQELDATGQHERALIVSKKLAEDLTKSGQTSQAAAILSRLSPEGQLLNLVRTAEKNGKTVSVADSIKFKELAAKVQEKSGAGIRTNQFNEIVNRLERGENVGVEDIKKLSDYLSGSEKVVKPNAKVIKDDLPAEFKEPRKREKIISFLDDAEQAALARIAARKNRLNSLPLDEWKDHAIVVSSQIAKGVINAATYTEDLVRMFGDEIRPVASEVFQKAQGMLKLVSRGAGEGDLNKAKEVLRRVSGQAEAEKAIVQETANHVKKLIADAKAGKLDPADVQKLRDYSDEIADMTADKPKRVPTQEERFFQSVKTLAKKIAQVENEKIPADQANREVSSLLRQVAKIGDEGSPVIKGGSIDNKALSDIAHDVMEKTRPNPKPTTLQEKIVEKYLKENPKVSPKDIDTLRELAKNVTRLSGDQRIDADIAMQKILNSYEKSSAWDKLLAIRYMSMLLNTSTQAINAASGPIMATTGHVADVFGTMLDIAMHHALKTPRTTTLYGTNPLAFIARYLKGLKVGVKAGAQGVNPAGIQSSNEIRGLAFKSLYNPLGLAERALGAVSKGPDFATYSAVYKSELIKQARVDAMNRGIKGKSNIDNHIQEFINDPPESAMLDADRIGKNTTFQRSDSTGGKIANYLNNAPSLVKPGVNAVIPFVRTPINMASSAVTMTPAGIIKGLFQLTSKSKASQREAIRTLSLGITGTGLSALGFYLFNLGIITGANDSGDKDVDAIKEQAGQGKYHFNQSGLMRYMNAMLNGDGTDAAEKAAKYQKGDHAFDYNKLQPLAFPLAIGAGLGQNKDKPLAGKLASAGSDAYGSLFGMSTLKGVQDVFQPQYGGTQGEKSLGVASRIAESFFKSFSPGGLAQEARRQDPVVRKTPYNNGPVEDVKGYFQSRIPGLSQSLPPSKTTLGMDKMNAPGFSGQYVNPFKSEVAAYSDAAVRISDLIDRTGDKSLAPAAPDKKVTGKDKHGNQVSIAIPQDRYDQLQEEVGHAIIAKIMALPQGLTDAKMAEKIKQIYLDVHSKERNKVKRELGVRVN